MAVEEPLEIAVNERTVSTTMRTPGHDIELALGWLLSEGAITEIADVISARECFESVDGEEVDVALAAGAAPDGNDVRRVVKVRTREGIDVAPRLHPTSSACGVCGTDVISATLTARAWDVADDETAVSAGTLLTLPVALREAQRGFDASGGLHAAALFRADGALVSLREDVGRHNAVDKVLGRALQEGELPLGGHVLQVSGRASAELVHKALMAGVPVLSAVSAPTTLAVDLARAAGLTLAGFVREGAFNAYSREDRIG